MLITDKNISEMFIQCPKCQHLNVEELYSVEITDDAIANHIDCYECNHDIYFKTKLTVNAEIVSK